MTKIQQAARLSVAVSAVCLLYVAVETWFDDTVTAYKDSVRSSLAIGLSIWMLRLAASSDPKKSQYPRLLVAMLVSGVLLSIIREMRV